MKEHLENVLELPVAYRVGILAGTVLLMIGIYWLYFFSPVQDQLAQVQDEIDGPNGLKIQIAEKEGIARNLHRFEKEVARLDIELKKALMELPDSREIHNLLSRISDKASDAGLEVRLFKPQTEQRKEFYAEVPVEIEVNGTYHQVATFFDEVGRLERIVNLNNFWMKEPTVNPERVTLKTAVVATAFRFLDESERPDQNDKKAKRRRGRKRR